jgi:hypothetical protein
MERMERGWRGMKKEGSREQGEEKIRIEREKKNLNGNREGRSEDK